MYARLRHPRYRRYSRLRRALRYIDWLGDMVTSLTGTGATSTFTAANATEQLTDTAHGLTTGCYPIQVSNSGGALPAGLSAGVNYWPVLVDANTFQLATSRAAAQAGSVVAFSDDGSGTHSWFRPAEGNEDIFDWNSIRKAETISAAADIDSL